MSSVDERIVEMRFDNQQFESGVQKSLHTLDRLKSGLNLESSAKSLESLQTTASSFDLSGVATSVDAVANRVSALGIVGDQVIRYLTTQFLELGEAATQTVKSLTVDQVGAGFDKYERKIQSVQTIMNATGMSVDEVNERLNKLNWFTDETSYSFTDMVDNIGKFTSSNVDLDVAVTSMIGIADAAGLAGASVGDASHAMEGFSKAIAQGYMSRQNWQWVRTAHMDTAQFKDTIIQTALDLGTLEKSYNYATQSEEIFVKGNRKSIVSVADFETAMKDGWLTTEVMNQSLSKFGGATEEIYKEYLRTGELTSDIINRMGGNLDELGLKSFRASQEAKTFTDAINSVKDAVSTSWMTSFEYIFGNKEEAVKLWTEVANEMWDVFASGGEERNAILEEWHKNGGYQDMLEGIRNAWEGIKVIGETVKDTFSKVFPQVTSEKLINISKGFNALTKSFKDNFVIGEGFVRALSDPQGVKIFEDWEKRGILSESAAQSLKAYRNIEKLKQAFGGLASIVKLVKSGFTSFFKIISPITKIFNIGTGSILDFAAGIGKFVSSIADSITESELLESIVSGLVTAVELVVQTMQSFGKALAATFRQIVQSDVFSRVLTKINQIAESLYNLAGNKLKTGFQTVLQFFANLVSSINIDKFLLNIENGLIVIESFVNALEPLFQKIQAKIAPAWKLLGGALTYLQGKAASVISAFRSFWNDLRNGNSPLKTIIDKFSQFGTYVGNVRDRIANLFNSKTFKDMLSSTGSGFSAVRKQILGMLDRIGEALKNVDWGKVTAAAIGLSIIPTIIEIGLAFKQLSGFLKSVTGLSGAVTIFFKKLNGSFKSQLVENAKAVAIFATSIAILVGSLKLISSIDEDALIRSGLALAGLAAGLTAIALAFGILEALGKIKNLNKTALGILAISGALAILSASLFVLQKIKWPDILVGAIAIGGLMTMLGIFGAVVKGSSSVFAGNGLIFISFAASVLLLVESIRKLSEIQDFDLHGSLLAIGSLMAIMAAFAVIQRLSKNGFSIGPGILSMTLSLMLLLKVASMIGEGKFKGIAESAKKNIALIAGIFGAMAALSWIAKIGGKFAGRTGIAILAMSASLLLVYTAVKKLGNLKFGTLLKGVTAVTIIMAVFSRLSRIPGWTTAISPKAGAGIAVMAASLLLVYAAVKKFGNLGLPELAKGLVAVAGVFAGFGLLLKASEKVVKPGPIIAMAAAITVLVGALAYFTLFNDYAGLAKSAAILGGILLAFGGSVALMSKTKFDKAGIMAYIGGVAAIATIAISLNGLKDIPWKQLLGTAAAISAVLVGMGACMRLLQISDKKHYDGTSAVAFAGGIIAIAVIGALLSSMVRSDISWQSMASFAGSISAVLLGVAGAIRITSGIKAGASLGALLDVIVWIGALAIVLGALSWLANRVGIDDSNVAQIERIGAMIGGFIGGIVGGLIGGTGLGMSVSLPMIASNLSDFITNLQPFIEGVNSLDDSFGTKIESLGSGLAKIGTAEVRDAWSNLINSFAGKGASVGALGNNMKALGEGMRQFNNALKGVDADVFSTNIDNLVAMIEAMKKIPKERATTEGGFNLINWAEETFVGTTDYSGFKTGMQQLGEALNAFVTATADIDSAQVTASVTAFWDLLTAFNTIPETGGLKQLFTGEVTWGTISQGLVDFGTAMKDFATEVTGLQTESIQNAIKPAESLNELLHKIPPVGGLDQLFSGNATWATISTDLKDFGTAMKDFSTEVTGLQAEPIQNAIKPAESLNELLHKIPPVGGLKQLFTGEVTWGTISQGLVDFGTAMREYSDAIGGSEGLNTAAMSMAANSAQKIVSTFMAFREAGITKGEMSQMGSGLAAFGVEIKEMSEYMAEFNGEAIDEVLTALEKLMTAKETYSELGGDLADSIMSQFELGLSGEQVTAVMATFADSVSAGITSVSSSMTTLGSRVATLFVNGLKSRNAAARSAGSSLGSNAQSGTSSGVAGMYGIGVNAAQGLINGVLSKLSEAYNAGYNFGKQVEKGARNSLNVNSPSRVMMEIGEGVGEGFIKGMRSMEQPVYEASSKLANNSILATSAVFSKLDDALDHDMTLTPVITPVLDLSNVSYGMNQMDGILNQDASLRLAGQIQSSQNQQNVIELLAVGRSILREIQNGSDLYFDDGAFAGRINRRLGSV